MPRARLVVLVLLICTAAPLSAAAPDWARRVLAFQKLQGATAEARRWAAEALVAAPTTTRATRNAAGDYVIATSEGALASGTFHAAALGDDLRLAVSDDGSWMVAGSRAVLHDGALETDPARVAAIHADMGSFRRLAFRPAGSAYPARATPAAKVMALESGTDEASRVNVVVDTTPPRVVRLEVVIHPEDPLMTRRATPPGVAVGLVPCHVEVTFSELMAEAPTCLLTQVGRNARPVGLLEDHNPRYLFLLAVDASPDAAGAATLAFEGRDRAGNELDPTDPSTSQARAVLVDPLPPDLWRFDTAGPGIAATVPADGATVAGASFPTVIRALIADYRLADPASLDTNDTSGVDWDSVGRPGGLALRLFTPSGREITGVMVARIPALELLLPDVTDPALGIFPDTDGDGLADPDEGTYRMELSLVDRVGNGTSRSASWGLDATPIAERNVAVSLRPVMSSPVENPSNPIPAQGTAVRRLDAVEVTSTDSEFDPARSTARLLFYGGEPGHVPVEIRTELEHTATGLVLTVLRDQDGDGTDDFENPAPGQYLPPGTVDPRWGRNDGRYEVALDIVDRAGNHSTQQRILVLDTTAPVVGPTFPGAQVTLGAPLRMVDAVIRDPRASSGAEGSGIDLSTSTIRLVFQGNDTVPAQDVNGAGFVHSPNDSDPTQPGYNPADHDPKLLFEVLDPTGHVQSLPEDGSWDGVYRIELVVYDEAGNQVEGTASFTYSAATTGVTTTPLELVLP